MRIPFYTGKYSSADRQHYIHTGDNGIDIWYEDKKLRCTFKTSGQVWELDYEALEPEQWYQVWLAKNIFTYCSKI